MKAQFKSGVILTMLILGLLVAGVTFGQEAADSTAYPQPGSVWDVIANPTIWFGSTSAVAGLTIFLTLMLWKVWTAPSKILKQVIAVAVSVVLVVVGNLLNIGFMAEFDWISTAIYGLVTGFMANGLYDLKNISK